jgi:Carboxypeptidase regulatory-like domain/Putative zinc-finger
VNQNLQPGAHPDADQLSLFAEGAATPREREQMLAHLAGCAECRQVMFLMQRAEEQDAAAPAEVSRERRWQRLLLPAGLAGAALACGLTVVLAHVRLESHAHEAMRQIASEQKPEAGLNGNAVVSPGKTKQARQPRTLQGQAQVSSFVPNADVSSAPAPKSGPGNSKAPITVSHATAVQSTARFGEMRGAQPVRPMAEAVPPAAPALPPVASAGQAAAMPMIAQKNIILQSHAAPAAAQRVVPQANPAAQANLTVLRIEQGGPNDSMPEVSGRVTDESGAVVPKAIVALRDFLGNTRQTTTGADGSFRLTGAPEGHYDLTVTAQGFQSNRQSIDLRRGELAMLQPVLNVGTVTQTVTVTSNAPLFQTESASVDQILEELPSRLPAIATATLGKRILSLDSTGSLFLSRNAVRIAVALAKTRMDLGKDKSLNGSLSGGDSGPAGVQRIFQLITEVGDVWTSEDGKHWRQQ